ncbi:lachesin-like [Diabrotica virgifera virgifera]|uniref:Lachesin-like isoform X1 n=1 Tax=Diabrotica virgifera virgifera TaxID=50390 RepID=A0A6P7F684_DIAVI|nr:lachesin-like [Diabrotica virgifera virgifera]
MRFLNRHRATRQLHNMTATQATFLFCTLLQVIFTEGQIPDPEPEFLAPLENHTVTQGRDVYFTCVVNHLGSYKVAWIKSDTKAILAIHTHMVAQNPRLSVTHNGHNTWKLHVSNVQKNDSGTYMCQINTDPMRSQMGNLEVVISPDILSDNEPNDVTEAVEGGTIRLKCKATGVPEPTVAWRREDGGNIILRHEGRDKQVLRVYDGESLTLMNVQRTDMGAYLCIASNGVPPSVSKRFSIIVHFHPLIRVSNQLVAAPITSDVHVQCYVEASPKAMNHWMRDNGEKLIPSYKYIMEESIINEYSLQMNLTILNLDETDFGGYICTSSNALGKSEGLVRLLEREVKSTSTVSTPKYIETKPRKPTFKDKSKKWKPLRKKENNDNKNEEEQVVSTHLLPESPTSLPTVTSLMTSSRPSWILLRDNNRCATTSLDRVCYWLIVLVVLRFWRFYV